MNKTAIVTGAAGFAGVVLVEELSAAGYDVYAVVRPKSAHNERLYRIAGVDILELDLANIDDLEHEINSATKKSFTDAVFFHTAWGYGGRYDYDAQIKNIDYTVNAARVAAKIGCNRFIATGSQAEYGAMTDIQHEDIMPRPYCDYGAAKVSACVLSKRIAAEFGVEWIWGRIFSLYGRYEPKGRMIRDVAEKLYRNETIILSSCRQNWDYLDAYDGARALIALAERGRDGEIYNIANGNYRPLKEFVEAARRYYNSDSDIIYGDDPTPFVSLQPDASKIKKHTGWEPAVSFEDGLGGYDGFGE